MRRKKRKFLKLSRDHIEITFYHPERDVANERVAIQKLSFSLMKLDRNDIVVD